MTADLNATRRLYDSQPQREWERMDRHRTEFAVTLRAMRAYLPPPPAHVLDCGGGPGRYSIELAKCGYRVTLFDLSPECLQLAHSKAEEASVQLAAIEHGTATEVQPFITRAGFQIVTILALSGDEWDAWVDLNYRVAADPSIHGCVEHLLAIATKPQGIEV